MNPVVHFEMPYEDKDRAAAFYGAAFGWKSNMLGEEMGNYVVVETGETDANHMMVKPGQINGGLYKRSEASQVPSVVIAVDDIHAAIQKIKDAGGTMLGASKGPEEIDDIPGIGLYCSIKDSEGNKVGVLQPKGM